MLFRKHRPGGIALVFILYTGCLMSNGSLAQQAVSGTSAEDPYLWLENVTGDRALAWVHKQNARTVRVLGAVAGFTGLQKRLQAILDSNEKIPYITRYGKYFYNFWRDAEHVRGIWRRTTLAEYRKSDPHWETVLDLDALARQEGKNWIWKGARVLYPSYDRALLQLSRGGADAVVVREFDLVKKQFVAGGFVLPEAKTDVSWLDRDHIYVGTDYGPGTLTDSGYPTIAKLWSRGTPLAQAQTAFQGQTSDVAAGVNVINDHGRKYVLAYRAPTFFTEQDRLLRNGRWVAIDKPDDAEVSFFADQLLLSLKHDWTVNNKTYRSGSLLAAELDGYLAGKRNFTILYQPQPRQALVQFEATKNYLILNKLENVNSRLYALRYSNGSWTRTSLPTPEFGSVNVTAVDAHESDDYFMTVSGFLTPTSLRLARVGSDGAETLKTMPAFFDSTGLVVSQHEVASRDGTMIPYFQVSRKGIKMDSDNPTLLYGYGGFEIAITPSYRALVGAAWLERGGVYVIANIRGGGEFGPDWHNAARREHRQRAYDDFIAVAEDLERRRITSPGHLGILGRSNGGLLMGVMLTQRPDLFGAVVCGSPLLDMKRYNKLLAGASWMDEYGNPDKPADWAFIRKYSPYQNVRPGVVYPPVLFTTSTRDDRVHPGHARKMYARMTAYGDNVLFYENTEGGHAAAANNKETAYKDALQYTFLWQHLR